MTSIPTTADLLRLLREDPDFRDEVRRLVLSQDLLELPERFARFEAYVERRFESLESSMNRQFTEVRGEIAEIRGDIVEIRADITEIRGDIVEIRADITEIRGDIIKNTTDIGGLKGAEYERRVGRNFSSYASSAFRLRNDRRLRHNRVLLGPGRDPAADFEGILEMAVENGEISDDELEELREADAVMVGMDQDSPVYFVGEFSVTVNNHDIDRAVARAAILGRATGSEVWPMVVGDTIPDPQRARAEDEGVALRQVAE